jgi:hypothetical protein
MSRTGSSLFRGSKKFEKVPFGVSSFLLMLKEINPGRVPSDLSSLKGTLIGNGPGGV